MSKLVVDTDSLVEVSQRHGGVQNLLGKLNAETEHLQEELAVDIPSLQFEDDGAANAESETVPSALVDQIVAERVSALMNKK